MFQNNDMPFMLMHNQSFNIFNVSDGAHLLGFAGMLCVVVAFYQTVSNKWSVQSLVYNVVNLSGAICLLISLLVHFNLGSFIIEVFWILISIKGLVQLKR